MGLSLGLGLTSANAGGGTPTPPFLVGTIVIEGDSITSGMPSTYSDGFYSYRYQDARADLAIEVRAQGSRWVGTDLDDDANTLMGNVAEDMAYEPDLVTALIGANDMALNSAATYKANLTAWYAAVKAERPDCRVAWSAPIPYNPNEEHANYANFTAQRAIVMEDARDTAVWGQWADYYLPLGEHPDWVEIGGPLYGDTVHPTGFDAVNHTGGQNRIYDQFKAAVDTIADAARASATAPYASVWPADETELVTATEITRRFIVSGIAHTGLASGVSVSGGDAQVRLNGAAYGSSTGRIYNGDVIDLKLATSEEPDTAVIVLLTIGSETRAISYTTAADVSPAEYLHGDVVYVQPGGGTTHTFEDVDLADGLALLAFTVQNSLTAVTLTPSGGGSPISAAKLLSEDGWAKLEAWTAPVAAGTYAIEITLSGWSKTSVLSYGTVQNANPTPTQVVHSNPGNEEDPHLTPALTVPANGKALVFFAEYGASIATANSPTVLIDEGHAPAFEGETFGLAIGSLPASGQGSFGFGYGAFARAGVVFAAGGE